MHQPLAAVAVLARATGDQAMRLIYPPVCAGCARMVAAPRALCAECWKTVLFIERPYCEVLGMPFDHDRGDGIVSPGAISDPPPYAMARAAVYYDGVARKLAQALKYSDRADLAKMMGLWMVRAGRDVIEASDLVLCVPLHRYRLISRRYNQSAELARAVAAICGKPFEPGGLRRVKPTRQQVGLGLRARQDNVRGAFLTPEAQIPRIAGRSILLVDDVLTTGATLGSASRALIRAGAEQVNVLTFARVVSPDTETLYA